MHGKLAGYMRTLTATDRAVPSRSDFEKRLEFNFRARVLDN